MPHSPYSLGNIQPDSKWGLLKDFIKRSIGLFVAIVVIVSSVLTPMTAAAESAGDLFSKAVGTVTVDRGGSYHSQARSIYSLGGGQVTSAGKKISLFSADGPSYNAGCAGISWHFGGFSFISMAEIQQMVEAISQAALGVVVDLAINVICPQCYAVMSTMREMANKMRGQTMDACNAAKNLIKGGIGLLPDSLKPQTRMKTCAEVAAQDNKSTSILGASFEPSVCGTLKSFETTLDEVGQNIENGFANWANPTKKPSAADYEMSGNRTYENLTALGYADGLTKNILLSITGMEIYGAKSEEDCKKTLANLGQFQYDDAYGVFTRNGQFGELGVMASAEAIKQNLAEKNFTPGLSTTKNTNSCFAQPLITDLKEIGHTLMCGFRPADDFNLYIGRMQGLHSQGLPISPASLVALVGMCMKSFDVTGSTISTMTATAKASYPEDPVIYNCSSDAGAYGKRCLIPEVSKLSKFLVSGSANIPNTPPYTGLVWFIQDALMQGVADIQKGSTTGSTGFTKGENAKSWVQIVEKSEYPLYRVINLAAVYPGQATSILGAYGTTIAAQHVMASLDAMVKTGNRVEINFNGKSRVKLENLTHVRAEIADLVKEAGPYRQQILQTLNEKRALVEFIVQMNKQLQSEVMSKGLMGNVNMATRLKTSIRDSEIAKANPKNTVGVK